MGAHPTYVCSNGESIRLGRRQAAGGEGEVYELAGDSKLLAKIYKKPAEARKAKKLLSMVQMVSPSISRFAAWPVRTLHGGADRRLCGFVMNRIADARPVHELDTPAGRRANFPTADWRFLITT